MAGGYRSNEMMSDINVTPFVDVMLVLLIIFMVTAPMLQQGEEVSLPQVDSAPMEEKAAPLIIVMDRDGGIWIQDVRIAPGFLESRMVDWIRGTTDPQVLLKADTQVSYGKVVEVMNAVRRAGVVQLGMLTQPLEDKGR